MMQITGTLLYYARAIDPTMHVALSTITSQQAKVTGETATKIRHLLDYAATHPDATIRYRPSDMILKQHSDASYLSEAKARSRHARLFYLGDIDADTIEENNGALLVTSTIMSNGMSSVAGNECGSLFNTCKEVPIRITLDKMGHIQAATPAHQVDNSTSDGFANNRLKQ